MAISNHEGVGNEMELLQSGLDPYVDCELERPGYDIESRAPGTGKIARETTPD